MVRYILPFLFGLVLPASSLEVGGNAVMELSSRLSKDLTNRTQTHLEKILGSGRSEVFIQVEVNLTQGVKDDLSKTLKAFMSSQNQSAAAGASAGGAGYDYLFPGLPKEEEEDSQGAQPGTYILPGFSLDAPGGVKPGVHAAAPRNGVPAQIIFHPEFLHSIGLEIKRIFVRVALDETLPADTEIKVQALMTDLLDLRPERGDRIDMSRQSMPSPLKERLRDPQFLNGMSRWAMLVLAIFAAFGALCFVGIYAARAFTESMTKLSQAVALRRNMEVNVDSELKEILPGAEGGTTQPLPAQPAAAALPASNSDFMNVPPDKALNLFHLIGREDPAHIAMVVAQLPHATRPVFLNFLEASRLNEVLKALSKPQYVEPEILTRIKKELEKRIHGVVGGEPELIHTFEETPLASKIQILKTLEGSNPQLYRSVRKHVLLFEDLILFESTELANLLAKININDLAGALMDASVTEEFKEKIFKAMPSKTSETLKEIISLTQAPSTEKILDSQDRILKTILSLIKQGTARHPLSEGALAGG